MVDTNVFDPIYGVMELLDFQKELTNTVHFQRLTRLKQLGLAYKVFPGATHTRAEHSLGVAWLARKLIRQMRINQPHVEISDRDEVLIVLAAQAHDLGHGIASHAFESWLRLRALKDPEFLSNQKPPPLHCTSPLRGPLLRSATRALNRKSDQSARQVSLKNWSHEEQSIIILQHAVDSGYISCLRSKDKEDFQFIAALIRGEIDSQSSNMTDSDAFFPLHKRWMLEIVNNRRCGIDVDRIDYLQRDAHHVFGSSGDRGLLNVDRILGSARVTEDGKNIAYDIDLLDTLYHIFHRRWSMFRSVYLHDDVVGRELALRSIMDGLFESECVSFFKSSAFEDIEQYLLLDDTIFTIASMLQKTTLALQNCPHLNRACAEWVDFQRNCNQFACVAHVNLTSEQYRARGDITSAQIAERVNSGKKRVNAADLVLHCCAFHFGAGDNDPLARIVFYNRKIDKKNKLPTETFDLDSFSSSSAAPRVCMTPTAWQEWKIRVYCRSDCAASKLSVEIQTAIEELIFLEDMKLRPQLKS